ncbi:hypothetical protein FI667_g226, partial [Globisporangium splendens]
MGQQPTEEELFQMISEVGEDMSGAIDFAEFLQVIDNQKDRAAMYEDDSDMRRFGLTINIEVTCSMEQSVFFSRHIHNITCVLILLQEMTNKLDVDGSGEIEFDESKAILT